MSIPDISQLISNNQKWVCLSFLTDKELTSTTALRVGGVFDNYEDACAQAKKITEVDKYNHVFVGEVGDWLPFDPDSNDTTKVKDSEYQNQELQKLMKGRIENQAMADKFHDIRKLEQMEANISTNIKAQEKNINELKTKLSKVKNTDEATTITNYLTNLNKQLEGMETKLKECQKNKNTAKEEMNKK